VIQQFFGGYADAKVLRRAETNRPRWVDGGLAFVLHAVPLGAALDYGLQGEWREMAISLTGDAVMLFSLGLSKVATSARAAKTFVFAGAAVEAGVGGIRAYDSVNAFINGQYMEGAGFLGEAFLRLIGAGAAVRSLRKPPNPLVEGADDLASRPGSAADELVDLHGAPPARKERIGSFFSGSSGFRCKTREIRPSAPRRSRVARRCFGRLPLTPDSGPG